MVFVIGNAGSNLQEAHPRAFGLTEVLIAGTILIAALFSSGGPDSEHVTLVITFFGALLLVIQGIGHWRSKNK